MDTPAPTPHGKYMWTRRTAEARIEDALAAIREAVTEAADSYQLAATLGVPTAEPTVTAHLTQATQALTAAKAALSSTTPH